MSEQKKTVSLDLAREYWKDLSVDTVFRDAENSKVLCVGMSREISKTELKMFRDFVRSFLVSNSSVDDASARFGKALLELPRLASEAGCFVGIRVTEAKND